MNGAADRAVGTGLRRAASTLSRERLDKRPLYMQIADRLKAYMIEQNLGPGDCLPTEKELMEIFQVSRSTVREALRFLQALGIVDIRQRQGAVLSEAKISNLMSQLAYGLHFVNDPEGDLWEARFALESGALPLVAVRAQPDDFHALDRILAEMDENIGSQAKYSELDMAFHRRLILMTRNRIVFEFARVIEEFFRHPASRVVTSEPERRRFTEEHREIRRAIEDKDVGRAQSVLFRHLWRYHDAWQGKDQGDR